MAAKSVLNLEMYSGYAEENAVNSRTKLVNKIVGSLIRAACRQFLYVRLVVVRKGPHVKGGIGYEASTSNVYRLSFGFEEDGFPRS